MQALGGGGDHCNAVEELPPSAPLEITDGC
jgi:hypothetical protein